MRVMVQFIAFVDATAFRGILACILDVLLVFLRIWQLDGLHHGKNLFWVIFAKIHRP